MRIKILLSLLCFFYVVCASAQYTWSNPQPSGHINNRVVFTNSDTGYIMNTDGDLIRTTNSGDTWSIFLNFPRCITMDVKDSIFVIGGADTTIYISADRGQSWSSGFINHNHIVNKIQVISKDTVFAVSKHSSLGNTELFRSVNGGLTWQLVNNSFIIKSIDFIDSKLAYAASFGGIYKTTNGGVNWQQVYNQTSGYPYMTLAFYDRNNGYAYQDLGQVIKTTDGGASWTVCLPITHSRIYTINFANATSVFLGGEDGVIYRSTDNGNTWAFKPNRFAYAHGIYDIHFLNTTTGFFVGHRGQILKTTDAGDSYQAYSPTYTDIKPLSFPTPATGYAADWSNLYKTTDTGNSWTKLPFGLTDPLYNRFQHLHFFSNDTGIATTESPVQVFKTYNGGENWQPVTIPLLFKDFIRGFFALGNTIYLNIEGAYGSSMLLSKDRGETWRNQTFNSTSHQQNLFFVDENTGYSTQGSFLYKTTDSAKTWSQVNVYNNYNYTLNNIWFTDAATGYIAGNGGFNLLTNDSGKTWTQFAITPGNFNFNNVLAIRFFNNKVGYLTSEGGGIYKSFDGGKNWMAEKPAPWECKTIQMSSDSVVYFAGTYGTILKKDMREYSIDSLKVSLESSCTARVSALVSAVLSSVDSIWFEYGTSGFTKTVMATPTQVKDSSIKVEALLQDLEADSLYQLRIKIYYRGTYQYSDQISFRPAGGLPKPTITFNGTLLSSSAAAGNQWFLNGALISGATGNTYQPVIQGIYTVQQKQNGCTSAVSDGFNFIATAINDPLLTGAVHILPNPVTTTLWIRNKEARKLRIMLVDLWGRTLKTLQTAKIENTIDVQNLSSGIYTIFIEDVRLHKKTTAKLVKL